MKKILVGILTFLGIGFSFCSADSVSLTEPTFFCYSGTDVLNVCGGVDGYLSVIVYNYSSQSRWGSEYLDLSEGICLGYGDVNRGYCFAFSPTFDGFFDIGGGSSSSSDITVYYNSGSSTDITCDGVQAIQINGLSSLTSTNTFTPYFNISYKDQDNQSLIESYSKDILYLENGQFKKTYTGNNDWILTVQGNSDNSFSGYLPTFDITGGINDVVESGNIFNNFAENSVKFTLSNIPSYIQYVILLLLLFFILGFIRKFRRK